MQGNQSWIVRGRTLSFASSRLRASREEYTRTSHASGEGVQLPPTDKWLGLDVYDKMCNANLGMTAF